MSWKIYTRGTIFPHSFSIPFKAHHLSNKLGINFVPFFYINIGNKLWWAYKKRDIIFLGNFILRRCKTKKGQEKDFKKFDELCKIAIEAADKIRKTNLSKCTDNKLIELYNYNYNESSRAHGLMNPYIDAIDVVFENFLIKKIKAELKHSVGDDLMDIYKELAIPSFLTYLAREEEDIIKGILNGKSAAKITKIIHKKYWWISLGWENMIPHDEKFFSRKIAKYFKIKKLKERLKKIKNYSSKIKNNRRKIIKMHQLSKNVEYWLEVMDKYAYYHDVRKEMQMRSIYASHLLMKEVSKRIGVSPKNLLWFWEDEVKKFLLGKSFKKEELNNRKKAFFCVVYKRNISWLTGERAIEESKRYIDIENKDKKVLKGFPASAGLVRGKVKVCSGYIEALKKIKKGDILVCGMTTPDYVLAMKKASAIITDEGGITCHAAIISRELNIPCIVSTKIATNTLRDGDFVEVDANRGIVTILKRK